MQTRYTSADQWAEAKDGVIPAPYALEEGEQIIDQYLEPVIFHNVNGPDIGVTTCGVTACTLRIWTTAASWPPTRIGG